MLSRPRTASSTSSQSSLRSSSTSSSRTSLSSLSEFSRMNRADFRSVAPTRVAQRECYEAFGRPWAQGRPRTASNSRSRSRLALSTPPSFATTVASTTPNRLFVQQPQSMPEEKKLHDGHLVRDLVSSRQVGERESANRHSPLWPMKCFLLRHPFVLSRSQAEQALQGGSHIVHDVHECAVAAAAVSSLFVAALACTQNARRPRWIPNPVSRVGY